MRNNETSRGSQSPKSAPAVKGKKSAAKDDTIRDDEEETDDKGRFASDDLELADDESEDELEASDEEDEDEEFEEEDDLDLEDDDAGSRVPRGSDDLN